MTDHLAHDIKTPLMAISGYAENILDGTLNEEEKTEYLNSIIQNVSFTDDLISNTLYLNHINDREKLKKEPIQINKMVNEILNKYTLLLDEKKIKYSVDGDSEIKADSISMQTIIENLISNAVKYTPDNGNIKIEINKKKIAVKNSVERKVSTKDLKMPFVRGDQARSNVEGHGLGLSLADNNAKLLGYTLSLFCSEKDFRAEIKGLNRIVL